VSGRVLSRRPVLVGEDQDLAHSGRRNKGFQKMGISGRPGGQTGGFDDGKRRFDALGHRQATPGGDQPNGAAGQLSRRGMAHQLLGRVNRRLVAIDRQVGAMESHCIAPLPGDLGEDCWMAPHETPICVVTQRGMKTQGLGTRCRQTAPRQVKTSRLGLRVCEREGFPPGAIELFAAGGVVGIPLATPAAIAWVLLTGWPPTCSATSRIVR
jgi:hypothetical protein